MRQSQSSQQLLLNKKLCSLYSATTPFCCFSLILEMNRLLVTTFSLTRFSSPFTIIFFALLHHPSLSSLVLSSTWPINANRSSWLRLLNAILIARPHGRNIRSRFLPNIVRKRIKLWKPAAQRKSKAFFFSTGNFIADGNSSTKQKMRTIKKKKKQGGKASYHQKGRQD